MEKPELTKNEAKILEKYRHSRFIEPGEMSRIEKLHALGLVVLGINMNESTYYARATWMGLYTLQ